MHRQHAVAIILCAGQGTRMGHSRNKIFLPLAGKPLLIWTLRAFERAASVEGVLLVAHEREVESLRDEIIERFHVRKILGVVAGGASRHQSEACALSALRQQVERDEFDVILIHDGARPFVRADDIDATVAIARESGAAVVAAPVATSELIVTVGPDGCVKEVLPPQELWRAQTPQAFTARDLLAAYDDARASGFEGTDTASTWERTGKPVRVVEGRGLNVKVTTPHDLMLAERLARELQDAE